MLCALKVCFEVRDPKPGHRLALQHFTPSPLPPLVCQSPRVPDTAETVFDAVVNTAFRGPFCLPSYYHHINHPEDERRRPSQPAGRAPPLLRLPPQRRAICIIQLCQSEGGRRQRDVRRFVKFVIPARIAAPGRGVSCDGGSHRHHRGDHVKAKRSEMV